MFGKGLQKRILKMECLRCWERVEERENVGLPENKHFVLLQV